MKTPCRALMVSLAMSLIALSSTSAGWWPFGDSSVKKEAGIKYAPKDKQLSTTFKQKTTPNTVSTQFIRANSTPTMLDTLSSGTKQAFSKATDVVTLKALRNQQPVSRNPSTWHPTPVPVGRQVKSSKPSFLGSLFKPKEEPKKLQTINDFLSLPRPK